MDQEEVIFIIEPQGKLQFLGSSAGAPVLSYITLKNPSSEIIYFKVETSAADTYCVRPNNGVIEPGKTYEIAVFIERTCVFTITIKAFIAPDGDAYSYIEDVWADDNDDIIMKHEFQYSFRHLGRKQIVAKATDSNVYSTNGQGGGSSNGEGGSSKMYLKMPLLCKKKVTGDQTKISSKIMDDNEQKLLEAEEEINNLKNQLNSLKQKYSNLEIQVFKHQKASNNIQQDQTANEKQEKVNEVMGVPGALDYQLKRVIEKPSTDTETAKLSKAVEDNTDNVAGPSAVPSENSLKENDIPPMLRFTNIAKENINYKIKPKKPSQYIYEPNHGIIEPGKVAEIAVKLQSCNVDLVEEDTHETETVVSPQRRRELNISLELSESTGEKFQMKLWFEE